MRNQKTNKKRKPVPKKIRDRFSAFFATASTLAILLLFLLPMGYGIVTAVKTEGQFSEIGAPWYPASLATYEYEGEDYELYQVPLESGMEQLALVQKGRQESQFVDPQNPEAGLITWEGAWRSLERAWEFDPQWQNFARAWETVNFPRLLGNTLKYAGITTFGAVFSSFLLSDKLL